MKLSCAVGSLGCGRVSLWCAAAAAWALVQVLALASCSLQSASISLDELLQLAATGDNAQAGALSAAGLAFDSSSYDNVYQAIRSHPDLRQFTSLCELNGVNEIISMAKTELTVFAPIDSSLELFLAQSKGRTINLVELAKHHIVHELAVVPEVGGDQAQAVATSRHKSYASSLPIYMSSSSSSSGGGGLPTANFVNNAKILATYSVALGATGSYQILHLIDQPIELAHTSRRAQLRLAAGRAPANQAAANQSARLVTTNLREPINLDEFARSQTSRDEQTSGLMEFAHNFNDLQRASSLAGQLEQPRAFGRHNQRLEPPTRDQLQLDRLVGLLQRFQLLGSSSSSSATSSSSSSGGGQRQQSTFFLPLGDQLEQLLKQQPADLWRHLLAAHVIPGEVLFTRLMPLGHQFQSAANGSSLSLAKTLPDSVVRSDRRLSAGQLLATPLLVQATTPDGGVASSEITLANIPVSQGVLHLIKRPLVPIQTSLLDYLNDQEAELSQLVDSMGSQTTRAVELNVGRPAPATCRPVELTKFRELLASEPHILTAFSGTGRRTILAPSDEAFARLRFDLRALLSSADSSDHVGLKLVDHDERRRRELIDQLIRRHIVPDRQLTVGQLVRLEENQITATDSSAAAAAAATTANGLALSFDRTSQEVVLTPHRTSSYMTAKDTTNNRAAIVHGDLSASNGILHVIDRVLGEHQETLSSLLTSIQLQHKHHAQRLLETNPTIVQQSYRFVQPLDELDKKVQENLVEALAVASAAASSRQQQETSAISGAEQAAGATLLVTSKQPAASDAHNPELQVIGRTIELYLLELESHEQQLRLMSSSVNLSRQLSELIGRIERDSSGDRSAELLLDLSLAKLDRQLTCFLPTDLAWLRLAARQPEYFRPLVHFVALAQQTSGLQIDQLPEQELDRVGVAEMVPNSLDSSGEVSQHQVGGATSRTSESSQLTNSKSSQSSQRLLQILKRHFVLEKRLEPSQLHQMDSLSAAGGATLRLTERIARGSGSGQPASGMENNNNSNNAPDRTSGGPLAALHSIIGFGGGGGGASSGASQLTARKQPAEVLRALEFGATRANQRANIIQSHETANGFLYLIDQVLVDEDEAKQVERLDELGRWAGGSGGLAAGVSSGIVSSLLLGAHSSALVDYVNTFFLGASSRLSSATILALIGTLTLAIVSLSILTLVLLIRRQRQQKQHRHQQLESGLSSGSSSNSHSGSTSTTKSL